MKKRLTAVFLCLCLLFMLFPATAFASGEDSNRTFTDGSGLCEHHTQHDESCGYTEGTAEIPCSHEHNESCGGLTDPEVCNHTHDEACGYVPATEGTPCTYVCEICNAQDSGNPEAPSDAQPEECTCETLCTEEEINADCPVCSAEGAELDKICVGAAPMLLGAPRNAKQVTYLDENGNQNTATATQVTSSDTQWQNGWYVVDSDVTINERVTVEGSVQLILASGYTLTAKKGINVSDENSFTVYAQSTDENAGKLTGYGDSFDSCIGGKKEETNGNITINGGTIELSSRYGAGIGSGYKGNSTGGITINGGHIRISTSSGAGIGAGAGTQNDSNITINGGNIDIKVEAASAGIGGGSGAGEQHGNNNGTIQITGGTVIANVGYATTTNSGGAGIGGGNLGAGGTIIISGGNISVHAGTGAGIGGGATGKGGNVTITGGTVTATSELGASIGAGASNSEHGTLTIAPTSGKVITADAGTDENSSVPLEGSPFTNSTEVISQLTGTKYFHSETPNITVIIKQHPNDQIVNDGSSATFTVAATGSGTLTYQWQQSTDGSTWTNITGATDDTYTTAATTMDMNGWQYRCVVKNSINEVTSSAALLTVKHNLVKIEYKAPTCTVDGNKEYWTCEICGSHFKDESGTTPTTPEENVIPATGHSYGEPEWSWSEDGKTCTVTFTCEKDETHKESPKVDVTPTVKKPATCTETGVTTYTATVEFNGQTHTATKDVADIPATGHSYGKPVWNWSEDGKTCTVTFTCEKDENHKETPVVKVTSAVKTPATCTEKGVTTYTATVEFNGQTHTDTKDVADIPATGHSYGKPEWNWSEDGKTCTVTFTCEKDETHKESPEVKVTSAVKTPATCMETGVTTYTATVEFNGQTHTATKEVADIPATGHSYGKPVWSWSEDGKTCTVTFTCEKDETHKESPEVKVTSAVKTPATCTETGVTTYTATVEFNGQTHTATKDVADILATGHSYGKPEWNWSEDGKTCTVTFTCENDTTHKESPEVEVTSAVKTAATCTETGVTTYTATVEFNGQTHTATKDVADIPATGHSYGEPEWNWTEDGKSCTVTFTCENDATHKETPEVKVTSAVKTPATCTETGVTTYTATVEFNGQTHTATKDVADIPATGHSYGEPEWNWAEDGKSCTVTFTCENDAAHKESPEVEVTPEVKKAATCTETGVTTYTATVKFNGETYMDSKDVADIPATGHKLSKTEAKAATCTEAGNKEYWTCETCDKLFSDAKGEKEMSPEETVIPATGHKLSKTEAKAATCTETGNKEYWTCETCGKLFSDAKGEKEMSPEETVIPATGHKLSKTEAKAATCAEAGNKEYWTCETCGKLFSDAKGENEIKLADTVIDAKGHGTTELKNKKEATCTEEGYTGDKVCKDCGTVLEKGKVISKIAHDYKNGKCSVCDAIDPGFKISITTGADSTWKKGSKEGLSFTSNAVFADFIKVQVDGKDLAKEEYDVKEGSTIVTLKASYLETLSVGKHTIAIVSKTGTAKAEFTVEAQPAAVSEGTDSPRTGDPADLTLWSIMFLASVGILGIAVYKRRNKDIMH